MYVLCHSDFIVSPLAYIQFLSRTTFRLWIFSMSPIIHPFLSLRNRVRHIVIRLQFLFDTHLDQIVVAREYTWMHVLSLSLSLSRRLFFVISSLLKFYNFPSSKELSIYRCFPYLQQYIHFCHCVVYLITVAGKQTTTTTTTITSTRIRVIHSNGNRWRIFPVQDLAEDPGWSCTSGRT